MRLHIQDWSQLSMQEFGNLCQLVDGKCKRPNVKFDILNIVRDAAGVAVRVDVGKQMFTVVLTERETYVQSYRHVTGEAA